MAPAAQIRPPSAVLLSVGDEILAGDIIDSNKAFLGRRCRELGLEVVRAHVVRDREDELVSAFREIAGQVPGGICLVTGGLGPTTDDLTAASLAAAAGQPLVRRPELAARLEAFFASRGRALVEANLRQADLPEYAEALDNPIGTATGFALELHGCWFACMPGVPREMKKMMLEQIEPRLRERHALVPTLRRIYRCIGLGESSVSEGIRPLLEAARERSPGLAAMFVHYRADYPRVQIVLEATPDAEGHRATEPELASFDAAFAEALGPSLLGLGADGIENRVVQTLIERGLTLGTAESCTGGAIGQRITDVPGASRVYLGGIISYANDVKIAQLGVPATLLAEHGAVSEPVARAMAEGARAALGSDLAVATTGIAGPEGGTPEKPVGTVDFAVSDSDGTTYRRLRLHGNRGTVRKAATTWALKLVWDRLHQNLR